MQNTEEVKVLLEKYWSGDTTLDEERALKRYFAGPVVAEQFRPMIPLFQTLRQEKDLVLERSNIVPMQVRQSNRSRWAIAAAIAALLAVGGWWMFRTQPQEELAMKTPIPTLPTTAPPIVVPTPTAPTLAVAETPVVKVEKVLVKRKKAVTKPIDPEAEMAMEEIKAALALVSSKLNKGKKAALKDINQLENMDKFIRPKVG